MLLVKQLMFSSSFAPYGCQTLGGETHSTHCNTTVNIHTHCGNRMIISQEMIGERFMIYCEALQFALGFFVLYFNNIEHVSSIFATP